MQNISINLDYARKAEGVYYGDGAAILAERVARAAAEYTQPRARALAAYAAIHDFAKELGMNPDRECFMKPEDGGWCVSFEAGPYSWAIVASEALAQVGVFAEPHYSFDLCFYQD